jgi:hypothetical protein
MTSVKEDVLIQRFYFREVPELVVQLEIINGRFPEAV